MLNKMGRLAETTVNGITQKAEFGAWGQVTSIEQPR